MLQLCSSSCYYNDITPWMVYHVTQNIILNDILVFTVCFLSHHILLHPYRSLILACPVILMEVPTTPLREAVFHFAGQLLKPFYMENTTWRVMCGAMGWWCMRYGPLDTSHLRSSQWKRYECSFIFCIQLLIDGSFKYIQHCILNWIGN